MVWTLWKHKEDYWKRIIRNILGKHVVASAHIEDQIQHNEKSFRYVQIDDSNEFYVPDKFRKQSKNNKQASVGCLGKDDNDKALELYRNQCRASYEAYQSLLEKGVGREQARAVLIPAVYTNWVWTASLQSVLHFISLRKGEGAQSEIVSYAQSIEQLIEPYVPYTTKFWLHPEEE